LSYDSTRVQASDRLERLLVQRHLAFHAGRQLSWSKDMAESHPNFFPHPNLETGLLNSELPDRRTLRLSDNATSSPGWARRSLTFVSKIEQENSSDTNDPTPISACSRPHSAIAAMSSCTDRRGRRLLLDSLNTYSGEANLAIQF